MPPTVAIPPAYEATGYRRIISYDGTQHPGRLAFELPASMACVDEPETDTRPARTRLEFVGTPTGAVPLTFAISTTSPIRINGGVSANFTAPILLSILPASGSTAGSMSSFDFTKLAGVAAGAIAALSNDGQHGARGRGALHQPATAAEDGFMPATDKVKLDGLAINRELGANAMTGTTTTRYLLTGFNTGTAGANPIEMPVDKAFSIAAMKLWFRVTGASGANISFTLRKNGAPVGAAVLTVASDAAANTVYPASFAPVSYASGDTWSVQIDKSAGVASGLTDFILTVDQKLS